MKINILFFGESRKLAKSDSREIDFNGKNINDLNDFLLRENPSFEDILKVSLFALNEEYASPDSLVKEGDTVAVIPPVQGG
jgi:molybdopterin synthase sulfur carrier subunit